jgi:hypothetical protein
VRSSLLGSIIAVAVVTTTLTFGAGLHTLVNTPSLYGWNWNLGLSSIYGVPPSALHLLDSDPAVDAYATYHDLHAQIDGQDVPILLGDTNAKVAPPVLSGHQLEADDQIVLGAATLASLHKHVGDTVIGSFGTPADAPFYVAPTRLTIVGTATLPAVDRARRQRHLWETPRSGWGNAWSASRISPQLLGYEHTSIDSRG